MATLPARPTASTTSDASSGRLPLRLRLDDSRRGVWWPQSRDLQVEASDLVDHFPAEAGRVNRLLFSRPDWDDVVRDGRGLRTVRATRGAVKVGSFPRDDTHVMVLTMAGGDRLHLAVIPSSAGPEEARRLGWDVAAPGS